MAPIKCFHQGCRGCHRACLGLTLARATQVLEAQMVLTRVPRGHGPRKGEGKAAKPRRESLTAAARLDAGARSHGLPRVISPSAARRLHPHHLIVLRSRAQQLLALS